MGASNNVDIVFVVDASASMRPTLEQAKKHLGALLTPISQSGAKVRLGLVAHSAGRSVQGDGVLFSQIGLDGKSVTDALYHASANDRNNENLLFTSDTKRFISSLSQIEATGDEETLIALDCALDFPFGPLSNTKRVVVLLSDEQLETGVFAGRNGIKIPELIEKIHARHVNLFCILPESEQANQLAYADRSEVEFIQGGDGLANVKFDLLFDQMGKSISVSSLQTTTEPHYKRGLFDQAQWGNSADDMVESD